MRVFLKNIVGQLKHLSKSLDKKSLLIDHPWALLDEELEMQRLIFKKDGELNMSKNGKVTKGSWEYFSAANSLLIDRGEDKILCNEEFIDEGVMILKLDGTENKFFALANENIVPDLDVERYLADMRKMKFSIREMELDSGDKFEILEDEYHRRKVLFKGEKPKDGGYIIKKSNKKAVIKNGYLEYICKLVRYTTKKGVNIYVDQRYYKYAKGEFVYKDPNRNYPLEDGSYKIGLIKKLKVKNGRIV